MQVLAASSQFSISDPIENLKCLGHCKISVVSTAAVVCKGTGQERSDRGGQRHTLTHPTNSRSVLVFS